MNSTSQIGIGHDDARPEWRPADARPRHLARLELARGGGVKLAHLFVDFLITLLRRFFPLRRRCLLGLLNMYEIPVLIQCVPIVEYV